MNVLFKQAVDAALNQHPEQLTIRFTYQDDHYWIKRRPQSKKRIWHYLQNGVAWCLRMPIVRSTVSSGGASSLMQEAHRLQQFHAAGIPAPQVAYYDERVLVTRDEGVQLHQWLHDKSQQERYDWLCQSMALLEQVHQAGLVHGRPMPKDILIKDGCLMFIDLEEQPDLVMSLEQAQARDVWLLMGAVSRLLHDEAAIMRVFAHYRADLSSSVMKSLIQLVNMLRPLSQCLSKRMIHHLGRDIRQAVIANQAMSKVLSERTHQLSGERGKHV